MENIEKTEKFTVDKKHAKLRIDIYLSKKTAITRSYIQKLLKSGHILVNGKQIKTSYKISANDKIIVCLPKPEKLNLKPEKMSLEILYEDDDIIVINKPKGICVHPGAGTKQDTLVSGLLYHCKNLSGIGGVERPGIVHRLDKDTSGVLLIAKNDNAHLSLSKQFSERKISKTYLALIHGVPKTTEGVIEKPIGRHPVERKKMTVREDGRYAKTAWKIIKTFNTGTGGMSLLEVKIFTGRTHQIRVHLSFIGHPIVGDAVYGKKNSQKNFDLKGQFLHSYKTGFIHPKTKNLMEFTAELPQELKTVLEKISE